jgi:hypothetical protein
VIRASRLVAVGCWPREPVGTAGGPGQADPARPTGVQHLLGADLTVTTIGSGPAVILDRIGDKWSVFAVVELSSGVRRFSEMRRALDGICQRMLTLTLRRLERGG